MAKNEGKGSKIGITVLVIVLIIVLVSSIPMIIFDGIVGTVVNFVSGLLGNVQQLGLGNSIREAFGMERDAVPGMSVFCVDDPKVEELKQNLAAQSIVVDKAGLTQVRLRKILLANIVSSALDNSLAAAPVTEEDILENINKSGHNYTSISDFTYNWTNYKYSKTNNVWPLEGTTNYKLYYDSDVFFYFKDEDKIVGDNENQWYLGAMGATTIQTENSDGEEIGLTEYNESEFNLLKTNYENNPSEDNLNALKTAYKLVGTNTIVLYTVSSEKYRYEYKMENQNLPENDEGENSFIESTVNEEDDSKLFTQNFIGTQELSLVNDVDTTTYAIPVELLIDLLDMTGSGAFLEEFIDYALEQISVQITAYSTQSSSYTYNKTKYNVDSNFILEIYDVINGLDVGEANFPYFKDIIFNRKYNGQPIERVTDIPNFENLDPAGDNANRLTDYLVTAYDPGSTFNLSDVNVSEIQIKEDTTESWELIPHAVNTWYGTMEYTPSTLTVEYYLPTGIVSDEEEFNNFGNSDEDYGETNLDISSEQELEIKYICEEYYNSYLTEDEKQETENSIIKKTEGSDSDDIYDNKLNVEWNEELSKIDLNSLNTKALGKIAMNDEGDKNNNLGAGSGDDYIYTKFKKTNIVEYLGVTKSKVEVLDRSNIQVTATNVDEKLKNFLELLKNETGNIPTHVGSEHGFKQDGKVVKYGDIYEGIIPAGDLLLDNGAQILFDILESQTNTQSLVNVFKYLAYLYTGLDYGVTLDDLNNIFQMTVSTGFYGSSPEERIWFALRNIGCSEIAAAAVLGNLYAESGISSNNLEGTYESRLGFTDESYTAAVNGHTYANFITDSAGYGLAQWTDSDRKGGLYRYIVESKSLGIDDFDSQVEFLITEIQGSGPASGYATAQMTVPKDGYTKASWWDATDIETATTAFCKVFERAGIERLETRRSAAQRYYDEFHGRTMPVSGQMNGSFMEIAQQCHDYIRMNNYYYSSAGHKSAGGCTCSDGKHCGASTGSSIPKPAQGEGNYIDCSAYVCWVLYEYGYSDFGGSQHVCSQFVNNKDTYSSRYGFVYKPASQAQAGDIVINSHHTEIYMGNGQFLGAGCTYSIRQTISNAGVSYLNNFTYAISVPAR